MNEIDYVQYNNHQCMARQLSEFCATRGRNLYVTQRQTVFTNRRFEYRFRFTIAIYLHIQTQCRPIIFQPVGRDNYYNTHSLITIV